VFGLQSETRVSQPLPIAASIWSALALPREVSAIGAGALQRLNDDICDLLLMALGLPATVYVAAYAPLPQRACGGLRGFGCDCAKDASPARIGANQQLWCWAGTGQGFSERDREPARQSHPMFD
jgi:hypothetical protein